MNIDRDKLIEMAKEAGFLHNESELINTGTYLLLEKFASLVSAHAISSMQTEQALLKRYGKHDKHCGAITDNYSHSRCTCGLTFAITRNSDDERFINTSMHEQVSVTSMQGDKLKGVSDTPLSVNEQFVITRQFESNKSYAYAHHNGFFAWSPCIDQAIKFKTRLEATTLALLIKGSQKDNYTVEAIANKKAGE